MSVAKSAESLLKTGRTAVAIAVGSYHTCALLSSGALVCWGYNINGALGVGSNQIVGSAPGQMGNSLVAVTLGTGELFPSPSIFLQPSVRLSIPPSFFILCFPSQTLMCSPNVRACFVLFWVCSV